MDQLTSFVQMIADKANYLTLKNQLKNALEKGPIYSDSIYQYDGSILFMIKEGTEKRLIVAEKIPPFFWN
jgi:hypothetical protein